MFLPLASLCSRLHLSPPRVSMKEQKQYLLRMASSATCVHSDRSRYERCTHSLVVAAWKGRMLHAWVLALHQMWEIRNLKQKAETPPFVHFRFCKTHVFSFATKEEITETTEAFSKALCPLQLDANQLRFTCDSTRQHKALLFEPYLTAKPVTCATMLAVPQKKARYLLLCARRNDELPPQLLSAHQPKCTCSQVLW